MTSQQAKEKASENFKKGFNCTQSVVSVFAEELGYDVQTLLKICQPFGGGICRTREICGTVSGMLFCLGMKLGDSSGDKTKKDEIYKQGQKLINRFKEINGSYICRELLGITDKKITFVSEERTTEYYQKRPCANLCGIAAQIFAEWLEENS